MNTGMEESGHFKVRKNKHQDSDLKMACVTAVLMNDLSLAKAQLLFGNYSKKILRNKVRDVINFLHENQCKVFMLLYDPKLHTEQTIINHKKWFVESIRLGVVSHPEDLATAVNYYADKLDKLKKSDQYIKALLQIRLLENVLRGICAKSLEFEQKDLESFNVTFDTETLAGAQIVAKFIYYALFCRSNEKPIICDRKDRLAHMITAKGYLDSNYFLSNLKFRPDEESIEVKIADVVGNHIYRECNGDSNDCDIAILKNLLSLPFSRDMLHFDKDQEFIDMPSNLPRFFEVFD